jgi:hypothetical protein
VMTVVVDIARTRLLVTCSLLRTKPRATTVAGHRVVIYPRVEFPCKDHTLSTGGGVGLCENGGSNLDYP